jgi:hypothetical protein
MRTAPSEDHLSYCLHPRRSPPASPELLDVAKLNHKVKSIKTALKLAERHNEELHLKIRTMKENHHLELIHLENECRKQKQLYDMLTESHELRGLELKDCRKRLKRAEAQQAQNTGAQLSLDEAEETSREYRDTIVKQEKEIGRLREEARQLYEQLYEKAARLKELEQPRGKVTGILARASRRTDSSCTTSAVPSKIRTRSSKNWCRRRPSWLPAREGSSARILTSATSWRGRLRSWSLKGRGAQRARSA